MTEHLEFDDRLLNRYSVEELAQSHSALHAALLAWFTAFGDFDDTSIGQLLAARGPSEVARWKVAGEASVASIPGVVKALDTVIAELEAALTAEAAFPERGQLEGLLDAARVNRATLVERAPALVARSLGSTQRYDATREEAVAAGGRLSGPLESHAVRGCAPASRTSTTWRGSMPSR